jgi:hypothetical protein
VDCNLDVVRELTYLFDTEGSSNGEASGSETRLMAVHIKLTVCNTGQTSSVDVKPPHYERKMNIKKY